MRSETISRIDRVLVGLLVVVLAWMFQIHLRLTHVDYNTFHAAGSAVLHRDWSSLYSSERGSMGGFLYPLGAGGFFALFAAFGESIGRSVFYIVLAGSLFGVIRWCHRELRTTESDPRSIWLTLLLGSRSINDSWISGNISLLLLALGLLSFHFYARSESAVRKHLSAASLGLAISFKVFPASLGAFWVWRRDLKQIIRLLAWTIALIMAPYAIFALIQGSTGEATDLFLRWILALRDPANFGSHEMIHFQNLSAAFHRLSSTVGWPHGWVMPALAAIAAALAFYPGQSPRAREYAVLLAWVPLLSPVTWHHVGVFYLPLIYLTSAEARDRGQQWRSLPLWSFFLLYTMTGRNVLGTELHAWVSNHSIPLLGVLALVLPATLKLVRSTTSAGGRVLPNEAYVRHPATE